MALHASPDGRARLDSADFANMSEISKEFTRRQLRWTKRYGYVQYSTVHVLLRHVPRFLVDVLLPPSNGSWQRSSRERNLLHPSSWNLGIEHDVKEEGVDRHTGNERTSFTPTEKSYHYWLDAFRNRT
jgi:hypothetical protein